MVPLVGHLYFILGSKTATRWIILLGSVILAVIVILAACNSHKAAVPHTKASTKAAGMGGLTDALPESTTKRSGQRKKAPALATISTPAYEAKLYWAIPFIPRGSGEGLIEADSGSQFILLDVSIQNTTTDKVIDMGEVLLTAKVRDEEGREYTSDPLIIAAFNLEYPFPGHREQYRSMKGALMPGAVHRTVVFGFEAPASFRNFVLVLEEGDSSQSNTIYEAPFILKEHSISDQVLLTD